MTSDQEVRLLDCHSLVFNENVVENRIVQALFATKAYGRSGGLKQRS